MTKSQERVETRRSNQERALARRREREQRDDRVAKLAVAVTVALKSVRRAPESAEAEAGEALSQMISTEGITVQQPRRCWATCLRCGYLAIPRKVMTRRSSSTICALESRPILTWTLLRLTVVSLSTITSLS